MPKGTTIMEEIFAKCDPLIYRVQMTDFPDYNRFVVSKKSAARRKYDPERGDGSYFLV